MKHLPTIKQMQYFVALGDCGSFSDAAEKCHVTQSTLSAGIAALENTLGQNLVDRTQRQITLTPLGQEVREQAEIILADTNDLVAHARHMAAPFSGPLRTGIIPTIAPYLLPRILPALDKKFPDLEIQLHEDLSARVVESLTNNQLDLVIMAFPYETPGMEIYHIYNEAFMLAAPQGFWPAKKAVSVEALRDQKLLLLEEGHCLRDHALEACQLQPQKTRKTFSASSLPTLIEMVRHGYGLTLLPEMAVSSGAAPKNLDILPFKKPPPSREIGIAWRKQHPRRDEFIALADEIKTVIGD